MLDIVYYPMSAALALWHTTFTTFLGEHSGASWVLAIIMLVVTIRAALLLPAVRQARFQLVMRELQPQVKAIQQRHKDLQRQSLEIQKLHKAHGVNVLASFVPIIVQAVVFIGLFNVLNGQSFDNAQFLAATFATTAIAIPLMIVAAVATHFTARISIAHQDPTAPAAGVLAKLSLWVFPAFALIGGLFLPVAILVYWVVSNVWTLVQQYFIYRYVT